MRHRKGTLLIAVGLILIMAAFSLAAYNIRDENRAAEAVYVAAGQMAETISRQQELSAETEKIDISPTVNLEEVEIPDYVLNPDMDMPIQKIDEWDYVGLLQIPSCDLTLPVISEWSYPALKEAPCRYKGSAYTDDLIIAAHNYRSHFRSLQDLEVGETVTFVDVTGNVFTYEVVICETLKSTAVEEMKNGEWDLTLFTCTYGGQYRVTVRCERVKEQSGKLS